MRDHSLKVEPPNRSQLQGVDQPRTGIFQSAGSGAHCQNRGNPKSFHGDQDNTVRKFP